MLVDNSSRSAGPLSIDFTALELLMEYPHPSLIESRLKQLAIELGDATVQPFRVDLVRVHGGKPPVYSVVIRSSAKESLRNRLEQLLNRKLTCGISSFMLQSHEAERLLNDTPRSQETSS